MHTKAARLPNCSRNLRGACLHLSFFSKNPADVRTRQCAREGMIDLARRRGHHPHNCAIRYAPNYPIVVESGSRPKGWAPYTALDNANRT